MTSNCGAGTKISDQEGLGVGRHCLISGPIFETRGLPLYSHDWWNAVTVSRRQTIVARHGGMRVRNFGITNDRTNGMSLA